jgi:uncharacterized protein DUF6010
MWLRASLVGLAGGIVFGLVGWAPFIPDPIAFHTAALALIAGIYGGFAFADGRVGVVLVEGAALTAFVVLALMGLWVAPGFIAVGLALHGAWDLAHRPRGIPTRLPRWYPPFCAVWDFVFAGIFLYHARELAARAAPVH